MMMALLRSSYKSKNYISISRVSFYSTETTKPIIKTSRNNIKKQQKNDNLYRRISPFGDPNVSIIPILDQWEKEGKAIRFDQLIVIIKSLRKFNRYTHALQVCRKKSEELMLGNSKGAAWEILLRMYASLGKKDDVYRIWNLYKTSWSKVYSRGNRRDVVMNNNRRDVEIGRQEFSAMVKM